MAGRHMSRCHGGGSKARQNFAGTYRAGKSRFRRFDDLEAPCSRASPSPESLQNPPEKGRKPPRRCGLALAGSAAGRSRLGGGSARLANPQRRCAAGMSRRARHAAGTSHRTATFRWKTATKACTNAQRTVGKAPGFFLPNPGVFGTPSVTVAHVPADQVRRKGRETPY